jgi:hypothetical protein
MYSADRWVTLKRRRFSLIFHHRWTDNPSMYGGRTIRQCTVDGHCKRSYLEKQKTLVHQIHVYVYRLCRIVL